VGAGRGAARGAARRAAAVPLVVYLADEISTSPHPVVSIDGARDEAWRHGGVVAVLATRANAELERSALAALLDHPGFVGVVYAAIFTRPVRLPTLLAGVPTVMLNCYEGHADEAAPEARAPTRPATRAAALKNGAAGSPAQPRRTSIVPAELLGGHSATEHLLEAGHRRIGFINGEPWMDAAQDRQKGYRRALASADIAFDAALVREGDWQVATGYEATLSLMGETRPPTAIFCANDLMAVGCLEALEHLGLRVPAEVSVIGYDDQEIARHTHPPLTTFVLPNYEMGRLAVESLFAEAAQPAGRRLRLKVDGRVVERRTVGPPARRSKRRKT
jgi:LacI family transcriptional regulator